MNNEIVQSEFFDNIEPEITQQKTWHIGLEDKLQDTLRQRAAKIKAVVAQANFIIGEELATAQKELTYKNGGFVKWLEEEVGIDNERAYEFIHIWEGYKMFADSANISSLGKSVLLAGAKKDVPQAAREEIVIRHEAGEKITLATADDIIERHKAEVATLEAEKLQIQAQFDFYKQHTQNKQEQLHAKINELENTPEPQKVPVYQDSQETIAKITRLEEQIKELEDRPKEQKQVEALQKQLDKLKEDRRLLEEANKASQERIQSLDSQLKVAIKNRITSLNDERIRQEWRSITSEARSCMMRLLGSWPTSLDIKSFESDDWERLSQLKATLKRVIEECDALRYGSEVEDAPFAFIEAPHT